jgi:CheY-like chemotaxis protein
MRTVLVADDSLGVRALLRSALEREGHRVLEAGSAAEVFEVLDEEPADVILLDVHLGADNGLEVGAELREHPRHSATKIVFMTGTMTRPALLRLSRKLDVEILAKPLDLQALQHAVR